MEYCDSGDLEKNLKKHNKLPEAEALPIFKEIASGCAYLYDKGIYHRDLKPENILLSGGRAKIADFGFAKVIEKEKIDEQSQRNQNYSIFDIYTFSISIYIC